MKIVDIYWTGHRLVLRNHADAGHCCRQCVIATTLKDCSDWWQEMTESREKLHKDKVAQIRIGALLNRRPQLSEATHLQIAVRRSRDAGLD